MPPNYDLTIFKYFKFYILKWPAPGQKRPGPQWPVAGHKLQNFSARARPERAGPKSARSGPGRRADAFQVPNLNPIHSYGEKCGLCARALCAPSDYKPPNGGFIYLQKQLNRLLSEFH